MNFLKEKKIALSTDEFIGVLALCSYEDVAREASLLKRDMTDEQLGDFAYHVERLLKHRGDWDEARSTQLVQEVENLIHAVMKAPKKLGVYSIRAVCINISSPSRWRKDCPTF